MNQKINGIICDPKTKPIYIKELNGTKETKSEEITGEYLSDQRTQRLSNLKGNRK